VLVGSPLGWSTRAHAQGGTVSEVLPAPPPEPSSSSRKPRNDWLFRPFEFWGVVSLNALSVAAGETETRLRPSSTSSSAAASVPGSSSRQTSSFGAASGFDLVGASVREGVSVRAHGRFGAGGGSDGFDGRAELVTTIGPSFGRSFVAFAPRLGLGGMLRGDGAYQRADLALPRVDLAIDFHPTERVFFELGATGAVSLVGRLRVDDAVQKTGGSFQTGAFAIVGVAAFSLVARADRSWIRQDGAGAGPVDTLAVHACLNPVSVVVFCPTASWDHGVAIVHHADGLGEVATRATTLRLTLGFGAIEAM
jgi:hypothetical protein